MNGRIEKEILAKQKMEIKLQNLPKIFTLFYEWMDAREKSYTTMDNYISHVVEFMQFYCNGKINEQFYNYVTDSDIEKYMSHIRRKIIHNEECNVGDDIRAAKWSSLNTFFKFLSQKKFITTNPMLLTERPKIKTQHEITYLTPEEINSVFSYINVHGRPMIKNRDLCIVALALTTGLRVSAIVNINIEDIDFNENKIHVIEKGRKIRDINFADNFKSLLMTWLSDRSNFFHGTTSGPLFISQNKNRISVDSVEELVKKYTKHLGKKITPHKLRASAAMNLYGSGVDILTIASVLGHEQITTTQRYTKAYDQNKIEATNILDNLI